MNKYQRLKNHLKSHVVSYLVLLIVVVIGVDLYYFLNTFPAFNLNVVEVRTNGKIDRATVLEYANLTAGMKLFGLNLKRISEKLEELAEVEKAEVQKVFPGKLVIEIKEREPFAQIRAGQYYLLDKQGVILPGKSYAPYVDLPLIVGSGVRRDKLNAGERCESMKLARALDLLKAISESTSLSLSDVATVNVRFPDDISFKTKEGLEIKIGRGDFKGKLSLLDRASQDVFSEQNDINYIDLRFGDVIVKPR